MAIKIKNRNPKLTDFSSGDIVINTKEGTLFYKSDKGITKIQSSSFIDHISASGEIIAHSGSFDSISSPNAAAELGIGYIGLESGIGNHLNCRLMMQ